MATTTGPTTGPPTDATTDHADRARDRGGVGILDPHECRQLLGRIEVGRVAFLDAGEPAVLPVNYAYADGHIVFRTGTGAKLHAALHDAPVAFEIDGWDSARRTGWSVLVRGTAEHVADADTLEALAALDLYPWAATTPRDNWVRIRPSEMTGRILDDTDQP